jgi:hypothetical protein
MKRVTVLLAALLLVLVTAAPAAAAKPEKHHDTRHFEPSFLYNCLEAFPDDPAYDFDVWEYEDWVTDATWWLDADGNPTQVVAHHSGTKTVYSPAFPGRELTGPFRYTSHMEFINYDPVQYYEHSTGVYWNLHTPQGGTAFHEAGQWSTLIEWPEGYDWPYFLDVYKVVGTATFDGGEVCEALAG